MEKSMCDKLSNEMNLAQTGADILSVVKKFVVQVWKEMRMITGVRRSDGEVYYINSEYLKR